MFRWIYLNSSRHSNYFSQSRLLINKYITNNMLRYQRILYNLMELCWKLQVSINKLTIAKL